MKQKRVHGGSKERKSGKKTDKSMDMNSLFAELPSIRRKSTPSFKQIALNEEKIRKALEKNTRNEKKSARAAAKDEMDKLSVLFGKSGL
jgi:hypothetical protein